MPPRQPFEAANTELAGELPAPGLHRDSGSSPCSRCGAPHAFLWDSKDPEPWRCSACLREALPRGAVAKAEAELARRRAEVGPTGRRLELQRAAGIRPEATAWTWGGRIVAGDLNVLVGPPGVGKSALALHLAAQATRGTLEGDLKGSPAPVVVASAEDHASRTIVPRLLAAGADLELVHLVRVTDADGEAGLTLPDDAEALQSEVARVGAALLVVDPVSAHLAGSVDSHRDASLRRALAPLARLAHETEAAVLAIAHTNKAQGNDWVRRVGGSVALGAAARNVLLCADDPDGKDRVLVHAKSNTGALAESLRYRVEGREVESDGVLLPTCGIALLGVAEGVTAADLLAEPEGEGSGALAEARDWLGGHLRDEGGEAPAGKCIAAARRDGIAERTLKRARVSLGARSEKAGPGEPWVWKLPVVPEPKGPREPRHENLAPLAPFNDSGGLQRGQDSKGPTCQDGGGLAPLAAEPERDSESPFFDPADDELGGPPGWEEV